MKVSIFPLLGKYVFITGKKFLHVLTTTTSYTYDTLSVNRNITVFITLIITVSTKAKMFQLVLKLVFAGFFE